MLAAVLTILGLAGGVAGTFFIMDAPRRRAVELRRRLEHELDAARHERDDNADRARRLADRDRDLRKAEATLDRRTEEFDRRAVTYDDLAAFRVAAAHEQRLGQRRAPIAVSGQGDNGLGDGPWIVRVDVADGAPADLGKPAARRASIL